MYISVVNNEIPADLSPLPPSFRTRHSATL